MMATPRPPGRPEQGWQHFEHVADVGVRGFGPSLERAFEQAALALTAVVTDPETVRPRDSVTVNCEAPNHEILLADWLNAIVFEMATRGMLFARFEVHIEDHRLRGMASGEQVDASRHCPAAEVKGATLSELEVRQDSDGQWVAQCILDV
jgi:tRNA nucleotidyltransferase (CCA-adding enzyme)